MKNINKKLLTILSVFIFLSAFAIVHACTSHDFSGWAWSENIGPISFSCQSGGGSVDYGVDVDEEGKISGHAWSEAVGTISFNKSETGTPPEGNPFAGEPNTIAKIEDGQLKGWARALSACKDDNWNGSRCTSSEAGDKSGGWDGWIKLSSTDYQVTLNTSPNPDELEGFAWGGEVIGTIQFNDNYAGNGPVDFKVTVSGAPTTLSVNVNGSGRVTGQGINCGADCEENYSSGTYVSLTADPNPGYKVDGWAGACTGNETTCNITMDSDKTVSINFVADITADFSCSLDAETWQDCVNLEEVDYGTTVYFRDDNSVVNHSDPLNEITSREWQKWEDGFFVSEGVEDFGDNASTVITSPCQIYLIVNAGEDTQIYDFSTMPLPEWHEVNPF